MSAPPSPPGRQLAKGALHTLLIVGLLVVAVVALAAWNRPALEDLATRLVTWGGLPGLALGVYVADGFHVPPPPQFHLWAVVASGMPVVPALITVCTASVAGGMTSHMLGRVLGGVSWASPLVQWMSPRVSKLFHSQGGWTVAVGSVTPVPFCSLCFMAGVFKMAPALTALLLALRVPRLIFFWWAIDQGWMWASH